MKKTIRSTIIISMLILSILVLTTGCLGKALAKRDHALPDYPVPEVTGKYELTKVDIFSKKDWQGTDIAVFGITLGDTQEKVVEKIGLPDRKINYASANVTNYEYSKQLTLPVTGMLIHFQNDQVKRITIKKPFNRFLQGSTKIGDQEKTNLFGILGAPSRLKLLSFSTHYEFYEKGVEVFMNGQKFNGFSFVYPKAEPTHIDVKTTQRKITPSVDKIN